MQIILKSTITGVHLQSSEQLLQRVQGIANIYKNLRIILHRG